MASVLFNVGSRIRDLCVYTRLPAQTKLVLECCWHNYCVDTRRSEWGLGTKRYRLPAEIAGHCEYVASINGVVCHLAMFCCALRSKTLHAMATNGKPR